MCHRRGGLILYAWGCLPVNALSIDANAGYASASRVYGKRGRNVYYYKMKWKKYRYEQGEGDCN